MPTELLTIGPVHTLVNDQIYALPTRAVRMRAQPVTNILISNDGTTFLGPTFDATGQCDVVGGFIKDSVGGALVKFGAY